MSAHLQVPSVSPPPPKPSLEGKRAKTKREDIEALEFAGKHLEQWCLVYVSPVTTTRQNAYTAAKKAQARLEIRLAELMAYDAGKFLVQWSICKENVPETADITGQLVYCVRVKISDNEPVF